MTHSPIENCLPSQNSGMWDEEEHEEKTIEENVPGPSNGVARKRRNENLVHCFYKYDKETKTSFCQIENCHTKMKGKFPTNLEKHLQAKHADKYKKLLKMKNCKVDSVSSKLRPKSVVVNKAIFPKTFKQKATMDEKDKIKKGSQPYEEILQSLALLFAKNGLQYCLIENESFIDMMKKVSFGKLHDFPSQCELSNKIDDLTQNLRANILNLIWEADFVNISIDLWSRPNFTTSFVGIMCHFYDKNSKSIKSVLLACRKSLQPLTVDNVYNLFKAVIGEWEIDESKIFKIITDNGSKMAKTFRESLIQMSSLALDTESASPETLLSNNGYLEDVSFLDSDADEDESLFKDCDVFEVYTESVFNRSKRLSCFSLDLMLAVQSAFKKTILLADVKQKVLEMIETFSNTSNASERLISKTGGFGFVKLTSSTVWLDWYHVIKKCQFFKNPIIEVCNELEIEGNLTPTDWQILESCKDVLAPFSLVISQIQGEKWTSLSSVYPMLFGLFHQVRSAFESSSTDHIRSFTTNLENELFDRFAKVVTVASGKFNPIYIAATFLDPKYCPLLKDELFDRAKQEIKSLATFFDIMHGGSGGEEEEACSGSSVANPFVGDVMAFIQATVDRQRRDQCNISPVSNAPSASATIDFELQKYLVDVKTFSDNDSSNYWAQKSPVLPLLSFIALTLSSVPATSAPTDWILSRAGILFDKNRHDGLSDEKVELEAFYGCNGSL